ncbi:MAG: hypothetical protein WC127_05325 [Acidaminococcaceae bacterium]
MKKIERILAVLVVLMSFCSITLAASVTRSLVNPTIVADKKLSALEFQSKYAEAKLISLAANTCAGTYVKGGKAAEYTYLGEYGWKITPHVVDNGNIEATFMIATNTEAKDNAKIGILAFRGSHSQKDWEINFKTSQVEFGGTNLKEFKQFAAKKDVGANIPKVHKGFDEYVMTALTLKEDISGDNIHDDIVKKLRDNPNFTLLITGHSLGGAAATLFAERLVAMGIPKEQIPVVTFGAPAIGNKAFAEKYGDKINLLRVVTTLDPIPGSLQSFFGGYQQFGTVKTLRISNKYAAFQHPISLYFDLAMKNFYEVCDEGVAAGYLHRLPSEIREGTAPLVAIIVAEASRNLDLNFAPNIKRFVTDEYKYMLPRYVIIDKNADYYNNREYSTQRMLAEAKAEGADYLIILEVDMKRMRQTDKWYTTLNQAIFKTSTGGLVTMNSTATRVTIDQGFMQSIVKDMEKCRKILRNNLNFIKITRPLVW